MSQDLAQLLELDKKAIGVAPGGLKPKILPMRTLPMADPRAQFLEMLRKAALASDEDLLRE